MEARTLLAADVPLDSLGASVPPEQLHSVAPDFPIGPHPQRAVLAGGESSLPAPPPASSTAVTPYDTLMDNGPSSNRVDIVIAGDGYTESEIDNVYVTHVESMLNYLFNQGQDPFPRYANFFNAHKVNVISNESGADKPDEGIFVDTALDARYSCNGITRLICVTNYKVNSAINSALSGAGFYGEMNYVSVNDSQYGGSGGQYAVFAGGASSANELALHEVGHSFSNLADEYVSYSQAYTGSEPGEVNVTTDPTGAKWERWHGYDQPTIGTIGSFEGGRYYSEGIYRPSSNSKMRNLGRPFDAVSREKIILDIYDLVDPLDDWRDNSTIVEESDPEFWVEVIDADVLQVQWFVDGVAVEGATGASFRLRDYGFGTGQYDVSATAYDATDWVRHQLEKLKQTVHWEVEVLSPETIQSVTPNTGAVSRSHLTSLTIEFGSIVNVGENAFELSNKTTGQRVALQQQTSQLDGQTIVQLNFLPGDSVQEFQNGSPATLVDGRYQLNVLAAEITTQQGLPAMESDFSFGEEPEDGFYRLFGDRNGDGVIDGQDFASIAQSLLKTQVDTAYDSEFDFDGDGDVDGTDYLQYQVRQFRSAMP